MISSGGLPLALFLLVRGYRRSSTPLVLAGWLVSAWQVSLGFTLGLQYCYLLAVLALLVLLYWWRGRLHPGPRWTWRSASAASEQRSTAKRSRGTLLPARLLGWRVLKISLGVGRNLCSCQLAGLRFELNAFLVVGLTWIAPRSVASV